MLKFWLVVVLSWGIPSFAVSTQRSVADACRASLMATAPHDALSPLGIRHFQSLRADRDMVYDFVPAVGRAPTFVIIHGLGDDMSRLHELAELAISDGQGALRVDLHGHGRTLREYVFQHGNLPREIDYRQNVEDVSDLIVSLNLQDVVLVGHSFGGAVAYMLTQELAARGVHVRSVHLLAPYVQRVDKYLSQYFHTAHPALDATIAALKNTGLNMDLVHDIMDPMMRMTSFMTLALRSAHATMSTWFGVQNAQDFFTDPWMDTVLRSAFVSYFGNADFGDPSVTERLFRAEAALRAVKGIRGLDLLDVTNRIPNQLPPTQLIGGVDDKLVLPSQISAFASRLKSAGHTPDVTFLKGENAGHMFPQTMASDVYREMRAFLVSHDRPH